MHEGVEARARLRRDVAPEGGEIVRAGVAGGDHRRRALERDQLVRRDADRRAVRIDVRVQVDEPRQHQPAGGVEQARGSCHRNVRLDRFDPARADADVAPSAQLLARIEQLAALMTRSNLSSVPSRRAPRGSSCRRQRPRPFRRRSAGDRACSYPPLFDCGEFILAAHPTKEAACFAPESWDVPGRTFAGARLCRGLAVGQMKPPRRTRTGRRGATLARLTEEIDSVKGRPLRMRKITLAPAASSACTTTRTGRR